MPTYNVGLRLTADSQEELLERLHTWGIEEDPGEGITSITHQPEFVEIPSTLLPPPVLLPPIPPQDMPTEPPVDETPAEPEPEPEPPAEPDEEPVEPEDDGGPSLRSVEPDSGPTSGGYSVTLRGEELTGVGGVNFQRGNETQWAWGFQVVDDETITVTMPQMSAGAVDVVVLKDNNEIVLEDGFTYTS